MQLSRSDNRTMRYLFLICFTCLAMSSIAQVPYNSAAPNGYTKKALVSEQVGLTEVSISYQRPKVNGREGKIWGQSRGSTT
jgi:hypothetical protein